MGEAMKSANWPVRPGESVWMRPGTYRGRMRWFRRDGWELVPLELPNWSRQWWQVWKPRSVVGWAPVTMRSHYVEPDDS